VDSGNELESAVICYLIDEEGIRIDRAVVLPILAANVIPPIILVLDRIANWLKNKSCNSLAVQLRIHPYMCHLYFTTNQVPQNDFLAMRFSSLNAVPIATEGKK
jgi:hypothetical protein